MNPSRAITIEDLRRGARRHLPRAVFDFTDGAAEDETTLRRNRQAFQEWALMPRVLVDVGDIDLHTTLLDQRLPLPLVLAPTGLGGMAAPRPEIAASRAAAGFGIPFTASSLSAVTIEDIARDAPGNIWFQLYVWRDRELTRSLVERAAASGCTALMLTVDVAVLGQRERDVRNGATIPPRITWRNAMETLQHPRWIVEMLRNPAVEFANVARGEGSARRPFALSKFVNSQFDPSLTWSDLAWLRSVWPGKLAVKGIMSRDDACRALDEGVDGVVVSNHGGRQLDGVPASLSVLPEIADAVRGRADVIFDGGVRRGTDIVKALALGARACMIGRPYLYGLGAAGESGARRAIEILVGETTRALALLGVPSLADLGRGSLRSMRQVPG